jgi:hypothetical protein
MQEEQIREALNPAMQTRNTIFTMKMPFVTILMAWSVRLNV